jgi:hypothetical protein
MDLDIEKRPVAKVRIYGEVYNCHRPTIDDITGLSKKTKKVEPEKQAEVVQEFIASFGVPIKVIKSMEPEHFEKLAKFFMPSKKK